MRSFDILHEGVPFEGTYELDEGEAPTQTHPGWPASVFLCSIMVRGTSFDLLDIINDNDIWCIQQRILKGLQNDKA